MLSTSKKRPNLKDVLRNGKEKQQILKKVMILT